MKKIVLSLALVMGIGLVVQAQDTPLQDGQVQYRPVGGDKNLEVYFSPLGGTPVSIPGLKFRSFSASGNALRIGLFIGYENSSTITQDEDFDDDNVQTMLELSDKSNSFTIAIQPGYEWHMTGTDRLSPYVGAFANIGYTSETDVMEMQGFVGDVSDPELFLGDETTKTGTLNLGLNLVAGFDYYFAQRLYIGTEVGFGFSMANDMKSTVTETTTEVNDDGDMYVEVTNESEGSVGNSKGFQLGPNVIGQIRVGWLF